MTMSDPFNRAWIIATSQKVIDEYAEGITLRQLYYRLVARGMVNNVQHYKRVVAAMTAARWDGVVDMEAFVDRERTMEGRTQSNDTDVDDEIERAKREIEAWMTAYGLERWSNQPLYVEVWIEKKALQGVFERPCRNASVGLAPCKGYPSLTFLNEAKERFHDAQREGKDVKILYFGDYDPSGSDIPRSIQENLERMGCSLEVERIALNPDLIDELNLPGVPPKSTDSRTALWDGNGAVELDAVEPRILQRMCKDAIEKNFDDDLYDALKEREEEEREQYREQLKEFVENFKEDDA